MGRVYACFIAYQNRTWTSRRNIMARPLKIAKAQAVLTITATTATTNVVTVSQSLSTTGVIRGMPFIPATTVGGLTGGVTYYVLTVLSDTTFLASATSVDANATYTPVTLTTTTGQTVAATVGLINSGFNNPAGSANTYGVVGGNTALFGNQVLANVAIGQAGTGTIFASTTSNVVGGIGTDLGNVANASVIEYTNTSGNVVVLGYVANAVGNVTVAIANAQATGNVLGASGNALTLTANLPVTLDANIGGLTAGEIYFVQTIANADAFSVSATPGGANIALTDATVAANAVQNVTILSANASANAAGVEFVFATPRAGYIVRQKGKTKYLVTDSTGLTAQCFTANVANTALTSNTMSIIGTTDAPAGVNVRSLNNYSSEVFYDTANAVADPDFYATFNTAEAANVAAGIYKPVITINKG
jgi:hypothetical protein